MKIKAISLWQPWASAMALGLKHNETRHWATRYRGPLAIHAAQKQDRSLLHIHCKLLNHLPIQFTFQRAGVHWDTMPRGKVVAVGELADVVPVERFTQTDDAISDTEFLLGDYSAGRFAWVFKNVRALATPIPARGAQGFFEVEIPEGLV